MTRQKAVGPPFRRRPVTAAYSEGDNMKKFAVLAIGSLVFSSSIFAADLRTATNFLHAYTAALCAAKHGDQTKAVELLAPFESKDGPELQATVRAVKAGDFEDEIGRAHV